SYRVTQCSHDSGVIHRPWMSTTVSAAASCSICPVRSSLGSAGCCSPPRSSVARSDTATPRPDVSGGDGSRSLTGRLRGMRAAAGAGGEDPVPGGEVRRIGWGGRTDDVVVWGDGGGAVGEGGHAAGVGLLRGVHGSGRGQVGDQGLVSGNRKDPG